MKRTALILGLFVASLAACDAGPTEPPEPPFELNETYELDQFDGKILPSTVVIGSDTVSVWGGVIVFENDSIVQIGRVYQPVGKQIEIETAYVRYTRTGSQIVFTYPTSADTGTISSSGMLVREQVHVGGSVQRVILARYLKTQ